MISGGIEFSFLFLIVEKQMVHLLILTKKIFNRMCDIGVGGKDACNACLMLYIDCTLMMF